MGRIKNVVEFVSLLKEKLQEEDPHISVDNEHRDGDRYTKLHIGGSDFAFRMKYGEGSLKNFR